MAEPVELYQKNRQEAENFADDFADFDQQQRQFKAQDWLKSNMPLVAGPSIDAQVGVADNIGNTEPEPQLEAEGADDDFSIIGDITTAIPQLPRNAIRGVARGVQEILDIGKDLDTYFNLPLLQVVNEKGEFDPALVNAGDFPDRQGVADLVPVPNKPKMDTATGNLVEGIARFAIGFKGVDKVVKAVKPLAAANQAANATRAGAISANALKGAAADLAVFETQEERLSNLVQEFPDLQNPVTEYLAANPEDGDAEALFKQALEGMVASGVADGFVEAVKLVRRGKAAKAAIEPALVDLPEIEAAGVGIEAKAFKTLGNVESEDLLIEKVLQATDETVDVGTDLVATTPKRVEIDDLSQSLDGQVTAQSTFEKPAKARKEPIDVAINPENGEMYVLNGYHRIEEAKAFGKKKIDIKVSEWDETVQSRYDYDKNTGLVGSRKNFLEGKPKPKEFEINFARIDGADDVKALMDRMVNEPTLVGSVNKARRGKVTQAQTLESATDINGFEELLKRRTGDAFNAEQVTAARTVYYKTTDKLMELAKRAAGPEATDADHFAFRRMIAVHHAVQKEFMGMRAEAGRALAAWKIPVGDTPGQNLRELEQVLTEFGGTKASQELARRLSSVGNAISTDQLNQITQKGAFARTADAMSEVWTLGLLTSPTTHIVNVSSNILTALQLGVERGIAAGAKDSPVTLLEAQSYFQGLMQSQRQAIKNSAVAFRTGEVGIGLGKIELPRIRATAPEELQAQGIFKPIGFAANWYGQFLTRYAGGALAAGDEYAKTILYNAQINALSTRQGIARGLEGKELAEFVAESVSNPSASLRADATQFANYGTFTKELGQTGQAFQRLISRNPALRYIVPFVRTPINIFKFTFDRTPLAAVSKGFREDIQAGGARAAQAMAKIGVGSTVMFTGMDLSMEGKITGAGPSDPKARSALRRTGWQPYSIKIGDTYYSYSRFEPVATPLGMAADMAELISNYEAYDMDAQQEMDKLVTASIAAIGNQVVGKTFLSGLADTVEVLSDPNRYAQQFINRYAGSIVPSGVGAIERAIDPQMEHVFNEMDAIKSRIPGLSNEVPNRQNVWAEDIQTFYPGQLTGNETADRVLSTLNPVYYSKVKDAPLDRWMLKNGFSINMPQKVQQFDGVRVDLRKQPEAYARLNKLRNEIRLIEYGDQTMKEFYTSLMEQNTPYSISFFSAFTEFEDQQRMFQAISSDYTKAAKKELLNEYPAIAQEVEEQLQLQQQDSQNRGGEGLNIERPLP